MKRTLKKTKSEFQKFPHVGFISHGSSCRIVKVKIERCECSWQNYYVHPFKVVSLEPSVNISGYPLDHPSFENCFRVSDPLFVTLHKSRKDAENFELNKVNREYANERRMLRQQQNRLKLALKRVAEYKAFKQIQTPYQ